MDGAFSAPLDDSDERPALGALAPTVEEPPHGDDDDNAADG